MGPALSTPTAASPTTTARWSIQLLRLPTAPTWWRSPPDLGEAIKTAQRKGRTIKRTIYQYPPNLLTTQGVLALARHGVPYALPRREAVFIRALDEMKAEGKEAFGGALLISDAAASRKAVAEQTIPHSDTPTRVWSLSEREMKIVEELNRK